MFTTRWTLQLAAAVSLAVAAEVVAVCPRAPAPVTVPSSTPSAKVRVTNTDLDLGDGIGIRIRFLEGRLVARRPGPLRIDDHSAILQIDAAEVSFGGPDSAALINRHLLAGSNLKRVAVWTEGDHLMQRGWFWAFIPIWVRSTISAENGLIHLHPVSFTGSSFTVIEKRVRFDPANGICIDGNEIFIDPPRMLRALLPVSGSVSKAFLRAGRVVEQFGDVPQVLPGGSAIELEEQGRQPVRIVTGTRKLTLAEVQSLWDRQRSQ